MKDTNPITTFQLFTGTSISANGSLTSKAVDLRRIASNGLFSVYYAITGDGTAKIEYLLCSTETGTYLEPSTASDIGSSLTKTSGPGSDGKNVIAFEPELAPFLKIKITETGTAQAITPNLWLNVQ